MQLVGIKHLPKEVLIRIFASGALTQLDFALCAPLSAEIGQQFWHDHPTCGPRCASISRSGKWYIHGSRNAPQQCSVSTSSLMDGNGSNQMADGLSELPSLTSLTSLWLQHGRAAPQNGDPACGGSVGFDIGDLDEAVHHMMLQSLTLASISFNTDLGDFWDSLAALKLTQLRLDHVTFDNFDPDDHRWPLGSQPVAMPAVASMLSTLSLNCRSLTMRCCGFDSLPPEFASLNQLEYLHIMDPYHHLRVLRQLPALKWLKVLAYRSFGWDQTLQLEFPPSLHFLDVKCNEKRHAMGESVYLRCCLDKALLMACVEADSLLQTVRIHSYSCDSRLSSAFLQLRNLQEVCLPEAGLVVLPDGMWLRQLKVLDLSRNALQKDSPYTDKT